VILQVAATFFSNLSLWLSLRENIDFVPVKSLHIMKHLKPVIVYFIPTIAASVYSLLDKSVINWVTHSDAENGYYEQATKIMSIIYVFVQSLATVSAARMSILLSENKIEEAKDRIDRSLQFMLVLAMPCAWGLCGIANRFVPVFFGSGYETVISLLYVMAPLAVILGFSVYLDGMYLVPSGQRGRSAIAVCIGSFSNLVLNFIFVYYWKSVGAAIATVITEIIVSALMIWMSKPILKTKIVIKNTITYCGYGFLLFVIAKIEGLIIPNGLICVLTQVISCAVIYIFILFVRKDEMFNYLVGIIKHKFG